MVTPRAPARDFLQGGDNPPQKAAAGGGGAPEMSVHHGTLIGLGILLLSVGVVVASTFVGSIPLIVFGISLCLGALALLVTGVRMAMSNVQVTVPGHYLLHPRTGTRFNPQQALAIQRRLDQMRREMSADSVARRPEPEPSLPSTPPPWTMDPPPSYDMVMNSQNGEQL